MKNLIKTYGVKDVDVIGKLDLVYRQKEQEHFESPIANENKQFFMAKKNYKRSFFWCKVSNFSVSQSKENNLRFRILTARNPVAIFFHREILR